MRRPHARYRLGPWFLPAIVAVALCACGGAGGGDGAVPVPPREYVGCRDGSPATENRPRLVVGRGLACEASDALVAEAELVVGRFVLPAGWKRDGVGLGDDVHLLGFSRIDGTALMTAQWLARLPFESTATARSDQLRELAEDYRRRVIDDQPAKTRASPVVATGADLQFEYVELDRFIGVVRASDVHDGFVLMDYREPVDGPPGAEIRGRAFFATLVLR